MILWMTRIIAAIFGTRSFLAVGFMAILGIILYNLAAEIMVEIFNFALGKIGAVDISGTIAPITGFSAWLLTQLRFTECISVIMSTVATKFILRKIPFIRW